MSKGLFEDLKSTKFIKYGISIRIHLEIMYLTLYTQYLVCNTGIMREKLWNSSERKKNLGFTLPPPLPFLLTHGRYPQYPLSWYSHLKIIYRKPNPSILISINDEFSRPWIGSSIILRASQTARILAFLANLSHQMKWRVEISNTGTIMMNGFA